MKTWDFPTENENEIPEFGCLLGRHPQFLKTLKGDKVTSIRFLDIEGLNLPKNKQNILYALHKLLPD